MLWHCWLGDRKGIRSVKKLDVDLLVVMIWRWFDCSFARLMAPVVQLSPPLPSSFASKTTAKITWKWPLKLGENHAVDFTCNFTCTKSFIWLCLYRTVIWNGAVCLLLATISRAVDSESQWSLQTASRRESWSRQELATCLSLQSPPFRWWGEYLVLSQHQQCCPFDISNFQTNEKKTKSHWPAGQH